MTLHRTSDIADPAAIFAYGFLAVGLLLGAWRGLVAVGAVPAAAWANWSHVHVVTVGGLVLLLFGTLPTYVAWKLDRPRPAKRTAWAVAIGVVTAFLLAWFGRLTGHVMSFDAGIMALWILAAWLFVRLGRSALAADPAHRDASVWLVVLAPFWLLWGLLIALGLYGHVLPAPGGWTGLREAHIHANGWGFVGLAIVAVMFDAFPRLSGSPLRSPHARRRSGLLLAVGVGPLVAGPWLGIAVPLTLGGLALYAVGYLAYLRSMIATYRTGTRSGPSLWLLLAQAWIIAPAALAPFVVFGLLDTPPVILERAALHFFFLGWTLPVALTGLLAYGVVRGGWAPGYAPWARLDGAISRQFALCWHVAVLMLGVGIGVGASSTLGRIAVVIGASMLAVCWGFVLVQAGRWAL